MIFPLTRRTSKYLLFASILGARLEVDSSGRREVYLKSPAEFSFEKITSKTELRYRDTIFVGAKSSAVLDFNDPRVRSVRIHENTIVVLSDNAAVGRPELQIRVKHGAATLIPRQRARELIRRKNSNPGANEGIEEELKSLEIQEKKDAIDWSGAPRIVVVAIDDPRDNEKVPLNEAPSGLVFQVSGNRLSVLQPKGLSEKNDDRVLDETFAVSSSPQPLLLVREEGGVPVLKELDEVSEKSEWVVSTAPRTTLSPREKLLQNFGIVESPPPPLNLPTPTTDKDLTGEAAVESIPSGATKVSEKKRRRKQKIPIPEPTTAPCPVVPEENVKTADYPSEKIWIEANEAGLWTASTSLGSFLSLVSQNGALGEFASYALPLDLKIGIQYSKRTWSAGMVASNFIAKYPDENNLGTYQHYLGAGANFYLYEIGLELHYFTRPWVEDQGDSFFWRSHTGLLGKIMWKRNFLFRQLSQGGGGMWLMDLTIGASAPLWAKIAGNHRVWGWGLEGGIQGWAPEFALLSNSVHARFGPAVYLNYMKWKSGNQYSASHSDSKIMMSLRADF